MTKKTAPTIILPLLVVATLAIFITQNQQIGKKDTATHSKQKFSQHSIPSGHGEQKHSTEPSITEAAQSAEKKLRRPALEDVPHFAIPRAAQASTIEDVATAEEIEATWPASIKTLLHKKYPKYKEGTNHIMHSVKFLQYRALSDASTKRLHAYAQYVSNDAVVRTEKAIPQLCWGPDTDIATVQAFRQVRAAALEEEDPDSPQFALQGDARWTSTATDGFVGSGNNNPVTIRWSFVPDGTTVPDLNNSNQTSNLIARLNAVYGSPTDSDDLTTAPWFEIFESAFNYWTEATGNVYIYEPNDDGVSLSGGNRGIIGRRGDVRIGGTTLDGNSNVLAFNYFPNFGDMVIDTADSSNFTNNTFTRNLFRNVIAHEHGHGMGFSHVCPVNRTKLMEPFATGAFQGIQFDDILTAVELYGDQYERNGSSKTNNTTATAHDLGTVMMTKEIKVAAISDGSDTDMYKFKVNSNSNVTITITPTAQAAYLEGEQNSDGSCTAGTNFNPATRQTLTVRLINTNGTTVIAQHTATTIGGTATIPATLISNSASDYFISVTGAGENSSSANNAQIYDLRLNVESAFQLVGSNFTINTESCSPSNGAIDPNEVINASITVTNTGTTTVAVPSVTMEPSSGLSISGSATKNLSSLAPGASATVDFTFSQAGGCGSRHTLTFTLNGGSEVSTFSHAFTLGVFGVVKTINFDASSNLPDGWSQTSTRAAANWVISTANPDSSPNSAFNPGSSNTNIAILESESFNIRTSDDRISFKHSYNLENTFDGGYLEISINGGAWQDIIAAEGTLSGRGYSSTINSGSRNVWSGNSNGYVTTTVAFPEDAIGNSVKLRWVLSNDFTISNGGWHIDDVVHSGYVCCESQKPTIQIAASDAIASEANTSDRASFTITADNAQGTDYNISYTILGTATNGVDYNMLSGTAVMPANVTATKIYITAIQDVIAEGDELITIQLSANAMYTIGANSSATATVRDLPFDRFRHENFDGETALTGENDDFDGDGYSNLQEYALGTDPRAKNSSTSLTQVQSDEDELSLSFTENTNLTDISITFETTSSLDSNSWSSSGVTIVRGTPDAQGRRTVTGTVSASDNVRFLRLNITRNP